MDHDPETKSWLHDLYGSAGEPAREPAEDALEKFIQQVDLDIKRGRRDTIPVKAKQMSSMAGAAPLWSWMSCEVLSKQNAQPSSRTESRAQGYGQASAL
jgi:hypothetical protein